MTKFLTVEDIAMLGLENKINWKKLMLDHKLSYEVMKVYQNSIDWAAVICFQYLSEEQITEFGKHFDEKCWQYVFSYQELNTKQKYKLTEQYNL